MTNKELNELWKNVKQAKKSLDYIQDFVECNTSLYYTRNLLLNIQNTLFPAINDALSFHYPGPKQKKNNIYRNIKSK